MAASACGIALAISAVLLLSGCTVSRAARTQALDLHAAEGVRLPLCARRIVDEACKAAGSALELVSAAAGGSHDLAEPVLEHIGLARDASCQSVCAAVAASLPSAIMPAFSDQGCRYDFAASKVVCDVDFRTASPAASLAESAEAGSQEAEPRESAPAEPKHHRPLPAAQRPSARKNATQRPPLAPSQPQLLLEVARLFRIYPYSFSTSEGALLEAVPVPSMYGYYPAPVHLAPGSVAHHPHVHAGVPQPYQGVPRPHQQPHRHQGVPQPQFHMHHAGRPQGGRPHPAHGQPHAFGNPMQGHVTVAAPSAAEEEDEGPATPTKFCPSCHGNQWQKIQETRELAERMMLGALAALRSGTLKLRGEMQKYFGADTPAARQTVMDLLYRTNGLLSGRLQYETSGHDCSWDTLAWVYPGEMTDDGSMHIIHLCKGFFRGIDFGNLQGASSSGRKGVRAYTLIHELTHHLDTDDVCVDLREGDCGFMNTAYGTAQCERLAARSPEKALENADSYALFVQQFL